jgi:ferredoxin
MNANIDDDLCMGCGLCSGACEEVFRMGREKALVAGVHVPAGLEAVCRQAADDCPASAIHVGEARALMLSHNSDSLRSWIAL